MQHIPIWQARFQFDFIFNLSEPFQYKFCFRSCTCDEILIRIIVYITINNRKKPTLPLTKDFRDPVNVRELLTSHLKSYQYLSTSLIILTKVRQFSFLSNIFLHFLFSLSQHPPNSFIHDDLWPVSEDIFTNEETQDEDCQDDHGGRQHGFRLCDCGRYCFHGLSSLNSSLPHALRLRSNRRRWKNNLDTVF